MVSHRAMLGPTTSHRSRSTLGRNARAFYGSAGNDRAERSGVPRLKTDGADRCRGHAVSQAVS